MIVLNRVSKTFAAARGEVKAVQDVTLHVEPGEIYGIIGLSGAGKSTLVRCINLLEAPDQGSVWVDGVELTSLPEKKLRVERKKIGMIFQQFNLMPARTVFQNVAYPLRYSGLSKQQITEKVQRLLELVEIPDKATAYPSQLSGGQKQRVAIARALANDPKVLLCDEATSALDPQTTRSILKLLRQLNKRLGITIVVITHEMAVVKEICDKVAVMEHGRVVESGDVFSIFAGAEHEITKGFVRTTSNLQKIYDLIDERSPIAQIQPGEIIVQFRYRQKSVSESLISTISRQFEIDVNIIYSDIELIGGAPIGGVVGIISGSRKSIESAIQYLIDKNVGVEVILDGRYTAQPVA